MADNGVAPSASSTTQTAQAAQAAQDAANQTAKDAAAAKPAVHGARALMNKTLHKPAETVGAKPASDAEGVFGTDSIFIPAGLANASAGYGTDGGRVEGSVSWGALAAGGTGVLAAFMPKVAFGASHVGDGTQGFVMGGVTSLWFTDALAAAPLIPELSALVGDKNGKFDFRPELAVHYVLSASAWPVAVTAKVSYDSADNAVTPTLGLTTIIP